MPPILIAGMHRSGTSWVARALHDAGLHLGDDLVGAEPSNPYGHFEDEHVVALHDDALAEHGLTWKSTEPPGPASAAINRKMEALVEERESANQPWGIKDPRLCLFLPDWLAACPNSFVLAVIRRPDEVVASLHRRHAQRWVNTRHVDASDIAFWEEPDLGLRLWVHYYRRLLVALDEMPDQERRLCFDWNATHSDASTLVEDLEASWNVGLQPTTTHRDEGLGNRAPSAIEVRDANLIEEAEDIWARLQGLCASTP